MTRTDSHQNTGVLKMKTFTGLLLILLCQLYKAQILTGSNEILHQFLEVTNDEKSTSEGDQDQLTLHSDIWAELRKLRDMVVELNVETSQLKEAATAADSLIDALQKKNIALEVRVAVAESQVAELQLDSDAQATEQANTQQKLSTLQERMAAAESHAEMLEMQQKGQSAALQELQNTNRVSKVAFSSSLLASGSGNTDHEDSVHLIFKNVITNIGNHYNPNTGYFTAPVRGVYYFRFTAHAAHTGLGFRMALVKNGEGVIVTGDRPTSPTDLEDSASNGAVLQLEVGDVVSLETFGDVWDDEYHRTTFSGVLLFTN